MVRVVVAARLGVELQRIPSLGQTQSGLCVVRRSLDHAAEVDVVV
jgi:hypothetical protein